MKKRAKKKIKKTLKRRATPKKKAAKKKLKKKVAKKTAPKTKKAKAKKTPAAKPKKAKSTPLPPATPTVPEGEVPIGKVAHYYSHLQVAVVELNKGSLSVGNRIHIKGHTSDFYQTVDSIEIEHQSVQKAGPGDAFGLKVVDHARDHDGVYLVKG